MTNLNVQIDHYVILLSEHNVAEFNAILQFKPKNVHVVATDYVINNNILERFKKAFNENTELKSKLHIINNKNKFDGERVLEVAAWIENNFKPHCEKHFKKHETTVLNYTGATKPISQLLSQAYSWSYLDYQAFRQRGKIYIDRSIIDDNQLKFECEIKSESNIDILSYLNLYVEKIEMGKNANSEIEKHELSLEIAQLRFDGQRLKEESNGNFFPVITPVLNDLWYNNKQEIEFVKKVDKNKFQCQWGLFNTTHIEGLKAFFEKIYSLDDNLKLFNITDDFIEIPTRENKQTKKWLDWISGGWFEQLIYSWLVEQGFQPDKEIKTGVVPKIGKKSGNETDILLLKNDKLYVMELKADIPAGKSPDEFRKQLNEHFQLGKFSSILVLSSIIRDDPDINQNQKEDFLAKCNDKRIDVIWVENKEQFQQKFKNS